MSEWIIDPDHSCAAFAITHMALARVRGQFTNIKGSIQYEAAQKKNTAVNVEIEVQGVNTGIKKRDEHLLTNDFFDVKKYPLITFRSTRVDFTDGNRCRVTGNLTLHGVSRTISFEGEYSGPHGNPLGDEISIGFSGSATINREDFGMTWGSELLEGGGLLLGKEVQIFIDVEADMVK